MVQNICKELFEWNQNVLYLVLKMIKTVRKLDYPIVKYLNTN